MRQAQWAGSAAGGVDKYGERIGARSAVEDALGSA